MDDEIIHLNVLNVFTIMLAGALFYGLLVGAKLLYGALTRS